MRPGHQPGQIQPGDILHHPAAVFDDLPAAIDKPHPQQIIPRRPGLHPARAGYIGGHHAANRRRAARAQQRPVVHRFKRQPLACTRQGRLHHRQRRARLRHQRQRAGVIQRDPRQPRHRQHVTMHHPAIVPGAAADNPQRPYGTPHHIGQFGFTGRQQHRGTFMSLG